MIVVPAIGPLSEGVRNGCMTMEPTQFVQSSRPSPFGELNLFTRTAA